MPMDGWDWVRPGLRSRRRVCGCWSRRCRLGGRGAAVGVADDDQTHSPSALSAQPASQPAKPLSIDGIECVVLVCRGWGQTIHPSRSIDLHACMGGRAGSPAAVFSLSSSASGVLSSPLQRAASKQQWEVCVCLWDASTDSTPCDRSLHTQTRLQHSEDAAVGAVGRARRNGRAAHPPSQQRTLALITMHSSIPSHPTGTDREPAGKPSSQGQTDRQEEWT